MKSGKYLSLEKKKATQIVNHHPFHTKPAYRMFALKAIANSFYFNTSNKRTNTEKELNTNKNLENKQEIKWIKEISYVSSCQLLDTINSPPKSDLKKSDKNLAFSMFHKKRKMWNLREKYYKSRLHEKLRMSDDLPKSIYIPMNVLTIFDTSRKDRKSVV